MVVVKLGGSLLSDKATLIDCLKTIEQSEQVVIVPGGGVFADQVRTLQKQWQFNDEIAHYMAILAMQQMALLLNGIKKAFVLINKIADIAPALDTNSVVIWSPENNELNQSSIEKNWDVSSDSLAVWLAMQLSAKQLIIVKSAEVPLDTQWQQMPELVDNAFKQYAENAAFKITLINKKSFNEYIFS